MLPQRLFSNPIEDSYEWVKQEYMDFRTYPRVDKAKRFMKDGKNKEAKVLLKKSLEIDAKNKKTLSLLMKLCIEERDLVCIEQYLSTFKDNSLGYFYKDKAQKLIKEKNYKEAIKYAKKALTYNLKKEDNNFIDILIMKSYIKLKKYEKATLYLKQKNQLNNQDLFKWSKFSDNLGDTKYSYILASKLALKLKYLKWRVELLNKNKNYIESSKEMELVYKLEKSDANRKKLIHIYRLTNKNKYLVNFYHSELLKECNPSALFFLLNYYKNNKKMKKKLLHDNHPYPCISQKKRAELSSQLSTLLQTSTINQLKKSEREKRAKKLKKPQKIVVKEKNIIKLEQPTVEEKQESIEIDNFLLVNENENELEEEKNEDIVLVDYFQDNVEIYENELEQPKVEESDETLIYQYQSRGERGKGIQIYENKLEKGYDEYSLSFLLDYYKNNKDEISRLLNQYASKYLESTDAQVLKSIGYAYARLDNKELAILYLKNSYIVDMESPELLKEIAYLSTESSHPLQTLDSWRLYLDRNNDPIIARKYHGLKAKLAHKNQECSTASNHYEKALKIKEDKYISYDYISLLKVCEEREKALPLMQEFSDRYPNDLNYKKELAYMYYDNKNYNKAVELFEYIAQQEPKRMSSHIELGYGYDKISDKKKTIESFKNYIDITEDKDNQEIVDEVFKKNIKNMIRAEEKKFDFYFSEKLRLNSYEEENYISPIYSPSYAGFGDMQLSFTPKITDEHLVLFVEASHAHDYSLHDTLQPSIGLKYKPFKDKIFYLSAQKMFNTSGEFTKEDVLLRASTGFFEEDNNESSFSNFYVDVSHFTEFGATLLYGNYEYGKKYQVTENIDIRPYLTLGGTLSNYNDAKKDVTKLDIGLGVATNIPMYETKYESYQFNNRIKLEARKKYLGNTKDDHTLQLQWELFY